MPGKEKTGLARKELAWEQKKLAWDEKNLPELGRRGARGFLFRGGRIFSKGPENPAAGLFILTRKLWYYVCMLNVRTEPTACEVRANAA